MLLFAKDFPDKLRSSILVSEVIGKKVKLKQKGREFSGLCPFHNEKTPSFTVNDVKGFYHCFGCAAHGDIISFVMNNEGLNYPDAVISLANDFSIPIPKPSNEDQQRIVREEKDVSILEEISKFFEKKLLEDNNKTVISYLQKRGLSYVNIKKFRLGFAPNSYQALSDFLRSKNYSQAEIERCGVVGKSDKGSYDKFRNRVIFPILNKLGAVIAFGGRSLGDDMPKYLNSSETELFKKNQTLYNIFFARKAIYDKGYAVAVEGYMDVISLAINGIENVVAALGTALGENHLKELFHITDKIVICLDGDAAGKRAAKRVADIALPLINHRKNIHFCFLPNNLDPDEFIKQHGTTQLEKLLQQAIPLSEAMLNFTLQDLAVVDKKEISAEIKAKIESNLMAKIGVITDATTKKHFTAFIKDELFKLGRISFKKNADNSSVSKSNLSLVSKTKSTDEIGQAIIAMLIKFPYLAQYRDEMFDLKDLSLLHEDSTALKDFIVEMINDNNAITTQELLQILNEQQKINNNISGLVDNIKFFDLNIAQIKFKILLIKDLMAQVSAQYNAALKQVDGISTHSTQVTDNKIREIFSYKNSLNNLIIKLEQSLS